MSALFSMIKGAHIPLGGLIFSINFINVMSYYHCIRYFVFPALFPSINMVDTDYTCITSVSLYGKSVRLLLK